MESILTRNGKANEFTRELTVNYELGSNLEEAVELFGAEAVFNGFKADARVALQAIVRSGMKATEAKPEGLSDDEIIAKVAEYKVGSSTRTAADPLAKLKALLGKMSPEARAELIAKATAGE